jgi:hypothetical protein
MLSLLANLAIALNIVSQGPALKKAAATGASTVKMPKDHLAEVFNRLDVDGNGYLDEAELRVAFEAVGKPVEAATLRHSFSLLDKNHDGMVDLNEFKAIAEQNVVPALAEMLMRDNQHFVELNEDAPFANARYNRDRMLVAKDATAWCADRCLATGHCEVLEDFFKMSTAEVVNFCENCVDDECTL